MFFLIFRVCTPEIGTAAAEAGHISAIIDLEAIETTLLLAKAASKPAYVVLNARTSLLGTESAPDPHCARLTKLFDLRCAVSNTRDHAC